MTRGNLLMMPTKASKITKSMTSKIPIIIEFALGLLDLANNFTVQKWITIEKTTRSKNIAKMCEKKAEELIGISSAKAGFVASNIK